MVGEKFLLALGLKSSWLKSPGLESSWLKNPGLKSSWLKSPGLKGLGLKLGVEMSFNRFLLIIFFCGYIDLHFSVPPTIITSFIPFQN